MWLISFGVAITNKAFHLGTRYDNGLNGNYRVGSWNANHATDDYLGNDYTETLCCHIRQIRTRI